jgi:heme/copper-type cytochrome/quinol oxidase subunit 2
LLILIDLVGVVVGVIVGILLLLIGMIVIVLILIRKRKQKRIQQQVENEKIVAALNQNLSTFHFVYLIVLSQFSHFEVLSKHFDLLNMNEITDQTMN